MQLDKGFFNGIEVKQSFKPIPAGLYTVQITDTETKQNKAGTGSYLKITFEVVDEIYGGRKLFMNLNIKHQNPVAESIARTDLMNLVLACGLDPTKFSDTEDLHTCRAVANVKIETTEQYGDQNRIAYFENIPVSKGSKKLAEEAKKAFGESTKVVYPKSLENMPF